MILTQVGHFSTRRRTRLLCRQLAPRANPAEEVCAVVATPPTLVSQFTSSSGRTVLQYFRFNATQAFRGPIQVAPGFELVEVALVGHELHTDNHVAPVHRAAVNIHRFTYDATTGKLEVGVAP